MPRPRTLVSVAVSGLLLAGCATQADGKSRAQPGASAAPTATNEATAGATPPASSAAVSPASVMANELGEVPVLMYHQIKENPKGDYDQTPAEFRAELERLYSEDYRPVTAAGLVVGNIDIPAGKHPVVLTFDDGTTSEAKIGADGSPTPDTALGILEAVGKEHPDFRPTASFYVNDHPFVDDKVLPWLVAHGYEVAVHTMTHANLKQLSDTGVQKELAGNYAKIQAAVPGYKITTMALPYGVFPRNRDLAHQGTDGTTAYDLAGVMLVGANPSPSPYAASFKPLAIPRIRSGPGEVPLDSAYWLDQLKAHPDSRYTSDGNPAKVSFPAASAGKLSSTFTDKAQQY
jgi:peptidoglycan/xylan/chitin deacetylase (PgdA/CDA1 family)